MPADQLAIRPGISRRVMTLSTGRLLGEVPQVSRGAQPAELQLPAVGDRHPPEFC